MSNTCSNKFFDTAKIGLKALKVTRKPVQRGKIRAVELPDDRMSSVLLLHLGQAQCEKLVGRAKIAGIPDIAGYPILPRKGIIHSCGLKVTVNDSDGKPLSVCFSVQCLKPPYATANNLPEDSVYFTLRALTAVDSPLRHQLRAFIVSELEEHPLPSVMALVNEHHVHVDYLEECLQALTTCIQSIKRVRTPVQVPKARRVTCLDAATSPAKLDAKVKDGEDFAALVATNELQNADKRRSNRRVLAKMAEILGIDFQPQVSESVQSVCPVSVSVCVHCAVVAARRH
jgi:hypothetical protein